jgi:hypothetical protein
MSDGHYLTDYRPSCWVQSLVDAQNNLQDSFQSRVFMQRNAVKLMDMNRQLAENIGLCHSECNFYHIDPNGHDAYLSKYKTKLNSKH